MIRSTRHFYATIGYSKQDIAVVLSDLNKGYYEFAEEKSNGRLRIYEPSQCSLKDIHNRLVSRVFSNVQFPFYITGSVKKRSSTINGKFHSGKKYHFKTDLSNYFGFVNNRMVYAALMKLGLSADVASLITKLTTHKGHLPQGAPTSPFLANIVGYGIDKCILELCKSQGITYTRYVDDIVLSSDSDFKNLVPDILRVITEKGFLYSQKKTKYKLGTIEVTGVDAGCNGLQPKERTLEKLNNVIEPSSKKGLEAFSTYVKKINDFYDLGKFKSQTQNLEFPQTLQINRPKKSRTDNTNFKK